MPRLELLLIAVGNVLVADTITGESRNSRQPALSQHHGNQGNRLWTIRRPERNRHRSRWQHLRRETLPSTLCRSWPPTATVIAEWKGPAPGFYGPRRITVGPDDSVYVVDQGRKRIVKFSPDGQVLASLGQQGKWRWTV